MSGFIMWRRDRQCEDLMKNPAVWTLLCLIAYRAKRTDSLSYQNLKIGEALIGDHKTIGLTEQQYRTAKRKLEMYGIVTFKGTTKGTIATLCDSTVFDLNYETGQRPSKRKSNGLTTTNNNGNNEISINKASFLKSPIKDVELSSFDELKGHKEYEILAAAVKLYTGFTKAFPDNKKYKLAIVKEWVKPVQELIEKLDYSPEEVYEVANYAVTNSFWHGKILNPTDLNKHFEKLKLQCDGTRES